MIFEWDENKNRVNKVKHGIDFESAITVFEDPLLQSRVDEDGRWQTIGYSEGCILLLFVAHTYHEADEIVVRIISARGPTSMKGSTMKKEASENIVRVKGVPKLTEAQLENLKRLAERPDDEIDYSDIPEITDFSGFEVGKFYRPMKEAVTVRLDADVVHWLKRDGKGYQTRLNAILRREMDRSGRKVA